MNERDKILLKKVNPSCGEEVNIPVYLLEALGNSLIESILLTERREKQGLLDFDGISMRWIG